MLKIFAAFVMMFLFVNSVSAEDKRIVPGYGTKMPIDCTKHVADFAWRGQYRLLVEMDGGVFTRGSHGSVGGILRTMRRDNLAALQGWSVLKFTSADMKDAVTVVNTVCATLNNSTMLITELRRCRGEL